MKAHLDTVPIAVVHTPVGNAASPAVVETTNGAEAVNYSSEQLLRLLMAQPHLPTYAALSQAKADADTAVKEFFSTGVGSTYATSESGI